MLKSLLLIPILLIQYITDAPSSQVRHVATISSAERQWVDSVFKSMTQDEKIGQLFMIRAHSDKGPEHIEEVERQILKYHIGGLCFFQGTPLKQAELTNRYQTLSKTPLMVAIDAEWGLGMRHKTTAISFPRQLTLGALQENKLIYDMGAEIAQELKRIGTQINFAPVVDININAANPVINDRSFGENKIAVTTKAFQYMQGMQDYGVMACAKHFPGHGDTDVDSHLDLPLIPFDRARLDSVELFPFRLLFDQGMQSVMVAHLQVPALESNPMVPTSLSSSTMTGLIKNELSFGGLIFSDALEMKGVTKNYQAGDLEVVAFKAGCDILCLPNNIDLSFEQMTKAIQSSPSLNSKLDQTVKKILHAKYRMGLNKDPRVPLNNLVSEVNNPKALALKSRLYEQAITLVKNKNKLIPITELDQHKIASLSIGSKSKTPFQWRLDSYAKVYHQQVDTDFTEEQSNKLMSNFKNYDIVIVSLHGLNKYIRQNFGISSNAIKFISQLSQTTQVVVVSFGSPYALANFSNNDWLIQSYEEDELMQDLTAQAIFGAIGIRGRLPVSAGPGLLYGTGLNAESLMRFGYAIPERVNVDGQKLEALDALTRDIVSVHAAPGGQLLVAREGKIIYHKAFGHQDYENKNPVNLTDVYDLASLTKVAASTLAVMRLYDEGKISLDKPMSDYLPEMKQSNKSALTLTEIMSHQAGLLSWIPFYKETLIKTGRRSYKQDPSLYATTQSSKYSLPIVKGLFLKSGYDQLILQEILNSELRSNKNYLYSDLGFYLIAQMVQFQSGLPIDQFMSKYFYSPLGLTHTLYNPYRQYPVSQIAPSEKDTYWRKSTVQGYVHDMGAAMLNGVSGHAGLFSNAFELGTIMQLLLNGGQYGGDKLIRPATVKLFATRQLGSTRRGIGFDMKELDPAKTQPAGYMASSSTFGHTGFTGTCAWVDPEKQLVFVFLCNRTYPSMNNNRLHKDEYRPRLLDAVYMSMLDQTIPLDNTMDLGQ